MPISRAPFDPLFALERPLRHVPRWLAAVLLAVSLAAIGWAAAGQGVDVHPAAGSATTAPGAETSGEQPDDGDLALYRRINERLRQGEGYYSAAMTEQRAANYPTRPFYTVRLPTMAWVSARFGEGAWKGLAMILLLANALAWTAAVRERANLPERLGAAVLVMLGGAGALTEQAGLFHDLVAGLLLSLALALYRPNIWWPSLALLGAALAIRELALPFLLLWLAFALVQGRRGQVLGLGIMLAAFAAMMLAHWQAVEALRLTTDPPSQGWNGLRGLPLFGTAMARLTGLLLLPPWLAAAIGVMPLLGWLALGGRLGIFATLLFAGYALALAVFARPENFYWGLLVLPAYAVGLAFVPRAVADLGRALFARSETRI